MPTTKVERKFDPDWDLVYVIDRGNYDYHVIKKPEPIPGEELDEVFVREGVTVFADGRWYYWKLLKPMEYEQWKTEGHDYKDVTDDENFTPDFIFANRINSGKGTVGHPAPRFVGRSDNNWIGADRRIVPNHIDSDILGDLILGHLMLAEYLQDGVENPKTAKKA